MCTRTAFKKKPAQMIFAKNKYGEAVKVHYWEYAQEAQLKDHDVYKEFLSNQLSTYNRWGIFDQGVKTTETRDMLEQVWTKADPIYEFKPLVNFTSYPCTDTPGRNKLMEKANLAQLPLDFGVMDYVSTQQDDYRNPDPSVAKPLIIKSPEWLVNRVICSDLTHNHGTAPPKGDYQCLDTHTPIGHIRALKHFRYLSFDPASGVQDFPTLNNDKQMYKEEQNRLLN